jgi:hypothetical protein
VTEAPKTVKRPKGGRNCEEPTRTSPPWEASHLRFVLVSIVTLLLAAGPAAALLGLGAEPQLYVGHVGNDATCPVELYADPEAHLAKLDLANAQPDGARCQGWFVFPIEIVGAFCPQLSSAALYCEGTDPVFGGWQTVRVDHFGSFRATSGWDESDASPDAITGHVGRVA